MNLWNTDAMPMKKTFIQINNLQHSYDIFTECNTNKTIFIQINNLQQSYNAFVELINLHTYTPLFLSHIVQKWCIYDWRSGCVIPSNL